MTDNFKDNARLLSTYILSLSLFAFAAALIYFTIEIASISKQIPDILDSVNETSDKIEPVIHEAGNLIDLVPDILQEVEQVRRLVPPILEEVALTREQIPAVLDEVAAVRKEIPAMLVSADKASESVVVISKEIEATRPLVPLVLKEVETTRESIPPMMAEADKLIDKARVAGKEASQGAVTGIFKGIISAPFVLLGDAGGRLLGVSDEDADKFTEEDFEIVKAISITLLNEGVVGDKKEWKNANSSNRGSVELLDIYTDEDSSYGEEDGCRTLDIITYHQDDKISDVERSLCKNEDDKWDFDQ